MATRFSLGGARILQTLANLRRLPAPSNSSTRLVPATPAAPAGSDIGSTPSKRLFSSTSAALASSDTGFTTISTLKLNNERQPYTTTATIRDKHIVIADEPSSLGGADLGANPYELLLAALGACTNITCSMYARRKGIKLESVETRLKVSKIHRQDCETCTSDNGSSSAKIDKIEKVISFKGDLTEAERQKLFEISEKCPVKLTLQRENDILSRLE